MLDQLNEENPYPGKSLIAPPHETDVPVVVAT
jgi:hypothetical protein